MKKILLILIGVIVIVGAWMASSDDGGGNQSSNKLYAQFGDVHENASASINSIDIYIDASRSMQGYLKSDDGRFNGPISNLYDCADSTHTYLLKTGNAVTSYNGRIADLINQMGQFDGGNTEFDKLLPLLCTKSTKGKVSAFVTDGILYVNRNTSRGLQAFENELKIAIDKAVGKRKISFAIFKYSARFDAPDSRSGGICYYDMDDMPKKLQEDKRPFYIIFTGTPEDILCLKTKEESLQPELALYFGVHDAAGHSSGKQKGNGAETVNPDQDLTLSATLPSCLNSFQTMYPSFLKEHTEAILTESNGGNKELKDIQVNVQANNNVSLDVTLPGDSYGEGLVKIIVENELPDEWEDLSTDDDRDINRQKRKTFGLEHLLEGLMKAAGEKEHLIEIQYNYTF